MINEIGFFVYINRPGEFMEDYYFDDLIVRKHHSPLPTYSFGQVESLVQEEVPLPTNHSMVIVSADMDWRDVLAAAPLRVPVIVAGSVTENVLKFIGDYGPDYVYTIGFDAGLNNSFEIGRGDVAGLFFPNGTEAAMVDFREQGIIASQMAYRMGVPLVFEGDVDGWDGPGLINLSGMGLEGIRDIYLDWVSEEGGNTDYLVLANINDDSSLLAGRMAGMRNGLVVPVEISGINYYGEPAQVNEDNGVFGIVQEIGKTVMDLGEMGMFHNSSEYRKTGLLYLGIAGDGYAVPFVLLNDPGFEVINDKDGQRIYNDIFYGDLDRDSHMDLSVGRFWGDSTAISLQVERMGLPKDDEAVFIGQYRHRKYLDTLLMGGGMAQAHLAHWVMEGAGLDVRRIVENRTESPLEMGTKDMFEMGVYHYKGKLPSAVGGYVSFAGLLWGVMEMGDQIMYAYLEHDWGKWVEQLKNGTLTLPEQLEVLYPDTDLGEPRILGYFGMGDEHWIIPPDDKDEAELLTLPYIRAVPMEELDFSNFLYDDHDMSAESGIEEQVLESGGMAASSSGIVHDPYTIYYSGEFFEGLGNGNPVGEAMRKAVNSIIPEDTVSIADLITSPGELPNLYFKTKYERLLLGDPSYRIVEDSQERGDAFRISPHNSYLAEAGIVSDYVIRDRILHVRNSDDYLVESGKPYVPVFVREITLPKGSVLKDVSLRAFRRTYRKINPMIVPWDEYYNKSTEFSGSYPGKGFWFKNITLIDGSVLVRVFVPAVLYGNGKARVLKRGQISIEYESPVEVMVSTRDLRLGKSERISVSVQNNMDDDITGTLWVWVDDQEMSREIEVGAGETKKEVFSFNPEESGKYQVRVILDSEVSPGPRYSDFRVWDRCRFGCSMFGYWFWGIMKYGCKQECCDNLGWLKNMVSLKKGNLVFG